MRISLPILILWAAVALFAVSALHHHLSAESPAVERPKSVSAMPAVAKTAALKSNPAQAAAVWAQARLALLARRTIAGRVHVQVETFGQRLVGSGHYYQAVDDRNAGQRPQWRLELLFAKTASLQQVCDGQRVWTVRQVAGEATLTSIDLRRVERALAATDRAPAALLSMGFSAGGFPRLMDALDRWMVFVEIAPATLRDRPVWALRGHWNRDALATLLPERRNAILAEKPADLRNLPEQAPDSVVVYLGRDDGFPYRIDLRRDVPAVYHQSQLPPGPRTQFSWEFSNPSFDQPLDPAQFTFQAGDRSFDDLTSEFLVEQGLNSPVTAAVNGASKSR